MRVLASLLAVLLVFVSGCGSSTPASPSAPPKADASSGTSAPAPGGEKSGDAVQAKGLAVAPLADAPEKKGQGLLLTIEAVKPGPGGKSPQIDCRSARLIALYVPEGSAPTPFLPAGPLKATWEGDLTVGMRDEYIFSADGRGKLTLLVNDAPILETAGEDLSKIPGKTVKLNKGKNHLTAKYESPDKGDAIVRLYWQSASGEFAREPLPIVQLSHNINQKPLLESRRLREGRELFATMRCTKCHDAATLLPKPGADAEDAPGMPELEIDAPNLSDAGARLNANWMAKWITNPRALRPESSMPQVLHGATLEKDATDIAGFLATLGKKEEKEEAAASEEDIKAGGGIVAKLGCIGCHTLPEKAEIAPDRIPLRNVRAKWKPAALREFLKQPDKHYAWIRMPNFRFSDDEIKKVSAFILYSKIDGAPAGSEALKGTPDVENGKKLVQSAGCLGCHKMGDGLTNGLKAPAITAIPDAGWAKGCMAAKAEGKSPEFAFSAAQRDAIVAFVGESASTPLAKGGLHGGSLMSEALPEFAERQIKQLRCTACHSRDDQDDVWSGVDSEVEALKVPEVVEKDPNADPNVQEPQLVEQLRPRLTWTGEKLKPEWMAGFISGKINEKTPTELKDENGKVIPMGKPRTWLHARMPNFPRRAPLLAKGLVVEHGCIPVSKPEPAPDEKLAESGRKLVGKNGGLGCTACHPVGIAPAVGVFEAPGINLMLAKQRILKSYFHRWIRDPLRVEAGSKMPTFATQGKTQLTDILGGDATQQFEAIWQYLLYGEKIVPPDE